MNWAQLKKRFEEELAGASAYWPRRRERCRRGDYHAERETSTARSSNGSGVRCNDAETADG